MIFSVDHGQQLMDHGFSNKHNWYDASWRVPLIMSQPGTLPSGERRDFAIWNDLPVSMLAAAGTDCPTMQGYDLYTPLRRGDASPRQCAVGSMYKTVAVATTCWKLEYYFEDADGRLFDRQTDPQEQRNLFHDDGYQDVKNRLLQGLLAWYGDTSDLKGLLDRSDAGGRIAQIAVGHMHEIQGIDSEERLNAICLELP